MMAVQHEDKSGIKDCTRFGDTSDQDGSRTVVGAWLDRAAANTERSAHGNIVWHAE